MITLNNKSKHFLWLVFKVGIVILLGFFIYNSLVNQNELSWDRFYSVLSDSTILSFTSIGMLFLLSIINWSLEIGKWKLLGSQVHPTTWKDAGIQSLSSLSFSLITPNRIGEYGAKALFYQKKDRKKILTLNFIGNFHQLMVTLCLGFIGLLFIESYIESQFSDSIIALIKISPLFIGVVLLLLNFNKRFLSWRKEIWSQLDYITKKLNKQVFLISVLRYLVFSHQFYLLLLIFGVDITYTTSIAAITSMYLISSAVPMLSLFDFVLKGSVGVMIFGTIGVSPSVILTITTLMWVLNFAIPSILGSYFVLTFQPISSK